jgi:hypothetical protein
LREKMIEVRLETIYVALKVRRDGLFAGACPAVSLLPL